MHGSDVLALLGSINVIHMVVDAMQGIGSIIEIYLEAALTSLPAPSPRDRLPTAQHSDVAS